MVKTKIRCCGTRVHDERFVPTRFMLGKPIGKKITVATCALCWVLRKLTSRGGALNIMHIQRNVNERAKKNADGPTLDYPAYATCMLQRPHIHLAPQPQLY